MVYIKISNFKNQFGQPDYKGLDVNKFISGSQIITSDSTLCIIATEEVLEILPVDAIEITQDEYITARKSREAEMKANSQSLEDKITLMQKALDELLLGGAL